MEISTYPTDDYTRLIKVDLLQCSTVKDALKAHRLTVIDEMFDTSSGKRVLQLAARLQAIEQLWAQLYVHPDMRDLSRDEAYVMEQETQRMVRDRIELFGEDPEISSEQPDLRDIL